MSEPNDFPIPPISPDVQRLLDKGHEGRIADAAISEEIEKTIRYLLEKFPGQHDRVANRLEGYANKIRSAVEAHKRKERTGGNQPG